jgi:hypothetical protein
MAPNPPLAILDVILHRLLMEKEESNSTDMFRGIVLEMERIQITLRENQNQLKD